MSQVITEDPRERAKFQPKRFDRQMPALAIALTGEQINILARADTDAWPFEKNCHLALRWVNGWSAREIADELGVTKGSLIGRTHRLMAMGILEERGSPIIRLSPGEEPKRPPWRGAPKRTLPRLASEDDAVFEVPIAVSMTPTSRVRPSRAIRAPSPFDNSTYRPVRREEPKEKPAGRVMECQWPIGEPGLPGFRFCCDASEPGRSYCGDHCKIAYINVRILREPER